MPSAYPVVPALPTVAVVAALAFAVLVWRLHRRRALTPARAVAAVVTCTYGAGVLAHVLFPFAVRVGADRDGMAPWHAYLQLVPFSDPDLIGYVLNVALFVPLGVLLPLVAGVSTFRRAALVGFLVSLTVEAVQLLLVTTVTSGRVADVDDLMSNTVGALVGFALVRLVRAGRPTSVAATSLTGPSSAPERPDAAG